MRKKNKVIFSSWFKQSDFCINYFDIGARGGLLSPWSDLDPNKLNVVGFEPDKDECRKLKEKFKDTRSYFATALWDSELDLEVHLNKDLSTSSVYPSNFAISDYYEPQHFDGRKTIKLARISANRLDSIPDLPDPDYIKIDTQGAEYKILSGASKILETKSPIVTVEGWIEEAYEGAPSFDEIIGLMRKFGYLMIDLQTAAAWHPRTKHGSAGIFGKPMLTGLEILFVKPPRMVPAIPENIPAILKRALLLELFGYRTLAIQHLEYHGSLLGHNGQYLLREIESNGRKDQSIFNRISAKFDKIFCGKEIFPSLR
jgi:FkbM family methyltransferase